MQSWGRGRVRGRRIVRGAVAASLVASLGLAVSAPLASAHRARVTPAAAQGHPYRQGVVPLRGQQAGNASTSSSTNDLSYGGGISGVGVTTGSPKVYLVFWGSQWGTPSYSGTGATQTVTSLAKDSKGMAPYLERFTEGLGTGSDANASGASTWSGVMTQYCQGVATGATSCPSGASMVGYPGSGIDGGALAGVWVDESSAAPSQASGNQIGQEAVKTATHFGDFSHNAEYVVVSPSGTHPDGFNTFWGQFCAWHDYTGDSTLSGGAVSSPNGPIAFTNLPYVTDMGTSCGENFVNSGSAGTLDGVSIVEGHEYAETITDEFPAGGWTDSSGYENGDKCAWISSGQGASQDISLGTGAFAVQSTWANDFNGGSGGCEIYHPIETSGGGSGNTVTVTNPGSQTSTVGTAASLQIHASDSASGQTLSYRASGLPAGLSINSSSGLISGTPTTAGSYSVTVTATDGTGASGTATFTWTVNSTSPSCTAAQLLGNPGFETGSAAPWSMTAGVLNNSSYEPPHSGSWDAWLDGYGTTHTDTLAQTVTIPSGCSNYTFSFWLHIDTAETTSTTAYDTLKVQVLNSSGTVVATLATFSNLNHASGYQQHSYSVAGFAGQKVTLKFTGTEDSSLQTSFVVDDTALKVS